MNFSNKIFFIFFFCLFAVSAFAQGENKFSVSAENFKNDQIIILNKPLWKYRAGDDPARADSDFNDSDWQILNPSKFTSDNYWQDWKGIGWFRTQINVDASLINQPISLMIWQNGASEIYLDGKLLQKFGEIRETDETEFNPQGLPVPLVFSESGNHTLAIRYSFLASADLSGGKGAWLARGDFFPGFYSFLQASYPATVSYNSRQLDLNDYKLFSGILAAFAFLHLMLFLFYRRERANLYYSIFAFTLAVGNMLSSLYNNSHHSAFITALIFANFVIFYSSSFPALLAFLYVAFAQKFSRFFWFLCFYLVVLIIVLGIFSRADFTLYIVVGFILLTVADALRIMIQALRRGKDGAWIIMAGLGVFTLGVLMLLSRELQYIRWTGVSEHLRNIALYLAIPIAVSVYLARKFARVNRNLETKLIEVEAFSEREIEHEKEKARMQLIEAENERRAKELEEARQLQLSMLPKKLPVIPNLEIAAYMKPATEVGGDYYDFHVGPDGTLTVAVGDATGHGLKAGTVVTATKGLFNNLAPGPNIPDTLKQISRSLKKMNLRGLFMALTILKIKDNQVKIGSAGMPAVLIYRSATQKVEEILQKALPLGSVARLDYREQEISLAANDLIVLMSDGFPEMFNEQDELFGYDQAEKIILENSRLAPPELIERLLEAAQKWAGARPQDDDVTFVVLQFKR